MATARTCTAHKHFILDTAKIKRAQKLLSARTETEAIDRALDIAITEYERDRRVREANKQFLASRVQIADAFGATSQ